jgi:DNA-binding LacI/PurR family transcriptional regulator
VAEGKEQIAIAAANFSHIFPTHLVKYIDAKLQPRHELAQISTFGMADSEAEKLKKFLEKSKPAGLICVSIAPAKAILEMYRENGVPVVLIDEHVDGFTTITTDNLSGGHIAGEYLAGSGRKKLAVISGRINIEGGYNAQQRFAGFKRALAEMGVRFPDENLVEVINYSYNDGVDAFTNLIKDRKNIDGIFCAAGDMAALGVIKAARELKVPIPEQLALVGYDDIEASRTSKPPLTTIRQPIQQMAEKAYEMLLLERDSLLMSPRNVMFKPELVKRESA